MSVILTDINAEGKGDAKTLNLVLNQIVAGNRPPFRAQGTSYVGNLSSVKERGYRYASLW